MTLRHVGVRALRNDLSEHVKGDKPIVIERHGKVLGIYLPVEGVDRAKVAAALDAFHAAVERVLQESDITREERAEAFMAEGTADQSDD